MQEGLIDRFSVTGVVGGRLLDLYRNFARASAGDEDAWRMAARVFLRSEAAKFALSAFGLTSPASPAATAARFAEFWRQHPGTHWRLEWDRWSARRVPLEHCDVTLATFDALSGRLDEVHPWFDDGGPSLPADTAAMVRHVLRVAYNETRVLSDEERPVLLGPLIVERLEAILGGTAFSRERANEYARRILDSCWMSFEPEALEPHERLTPPDFLHRKHAGAGIFNVVCRPTAEGQAVDLWLQANHSAVDGTPMQEMLTALSQQWGITAPLRVSQPSHDWPLQRASTPDGGDTIHAVLQMVDCGPLMRCRARLQSELGRGVPLSALLMWALGWGSALAERKFAVAVDLPARDGLARTTALVPVRPTNYDNSLSGCGRYLADFGKSISDVKARRGSAWSMLESFAPLPPRLKVANARWLPDFAHEALGTVGVSLIRQAGVFVAPYHAAFSDGFIAMGELGALSDNPHVAAVTVKGSHERAQRVSAAVREALTEMDRYFGWGEVTDGGV